jgi:hypothetical protein
MSRIVRPESIQCALCGKPVERVETWEHGDNFKGRKIRIRVYCHGASEYEDVPAELLGDKRIDFGKAFVPPPALPSGQGRKV